MEQTRTRNIKTCILQVLNSLKQERVPVKQMLEHLKDLGYDICPQTLRAKVADLILYDKKVVGVDDGGYFIPKTRAELNHAKEFRIKPAKTTILLAEKLESNYEETLQETFNKNQLSFSEPI